MFRKQDEGIICLFSLILSKLKHAFSPIELVSFNKYNYIISPESVMCDFCCGRYSLHYMEKKKKKL